MIRVIECFIITYTICKPSTSIYIFDNRFSVLGYLLSGNRDSNYSYWTNLQYKQDDTDDHKWVQLLYCDQGKCCMEIKYRLKDSFYLHFWTILICQYYWWVNLLLTIPHLLFLKWLLDSFFPYIFSMHKLLL